MVKKISGTDKTRSTSGPSGIKEKAPIESAKVDSLQKVGQVQSQAGTGKLRHSTRPMTAEEREHLMHLVDEEAHKLFGEGKLPESKKEKLTRGVKLTLAAGLLTEDETSDKKK